MRRTLLALGLFASAWLLTAGAAPPDSLGAKITREKKLKAKITLNCDNLPLREILDEIKGAVHDAGAGDVRIKPAPNEGITLTSRFTIKAKNESLEVVLDKLLKEKGWGYVVHVGKPGEQDDGAIFLVGKPLRGYAEGEGPKGKKEEPKKKEVPVTKKEEPKKKDEPKADDKAEKAATGQLNFAKMYIDDGKPEKAKPILQRILKNYANTKAAGEAKQLLEKINK